MNVNLKSILKLLEYIGLAILFVLKWLFIIFTFLWKNIGEIQNIYLKISLWILLTSIFLFGGFFVYDNREVLAKEGIKGVMCLRFPKSCIKHEIREEYYSGSGVLND